MFELTLKALLTGLILSLMIGPAFFLLLETSIKKGIRAAITFDAGILASDLIYILVAYVFYAEVAVITGKHVELFKFIGGTLFLIYGIVSIFKKQKLTTIEEIENLSHSSKDYLLFFLKGFVLNIANPMIIFYWFSVMALGGKNGENSGLDTLYFIGVLIVVFFSIDVLKIIGAKKLRPFITDPVLKSLNRIIGLILCLFGLILILQAAFVKI